MIKGLSHEDMENYQKLLAFLSIYLRIGVIWNYAGKNIPNLRIKGENGDKNV